MTSGLDRAAKSGHEAHKLVIRMTENGRSILNLNLPASSVRNLSKLIPESLCEMISKAGVELLAIEQRFQSGPLEQGSVLALNIPERGRQVLLYLH